MAPRNPLIFDGHNDTLLAIHGVKDAPRSFFEESDEGHIDLPRARAGGFGGGFFAIFVPNEEPLDAALRKETEAGYEYPLANAIDCDRARKFTSEIIETLVQTERQSEGAFRVVRRASEIRECLESDTIAAILHFEGAEALGENLEALHEFYQLGLRSVGIVWSRPNACGHGVPFRFPGTPDIGPGLTDMGKQLVRSCNELGIVIDLSHLNEAGFNDVAELSSKPLIATHCSAHALCATPRNLTDRQLDVIAASGGIVGINFAVPFLRADGKSDQDIPLTEITRHVEYVTERIGIDHVALGSDFDGCGIATSLKDVAGLPRLVDTLRECGFDETALRKIAHENWLRVLEATWGE